MRKEHGSAVAALRVAGLFAMLCAAWVHVLLLRPKTLLQRGQWRMRWCQRIVRFLGCDVTRLGVVPQRGLIVANHVSYLDVLILGAMTPASFVSKLEVRRWPLIGMLTATGGTIYLDRESPRAVAAVNRAIADALRQDVPVVVFPEGTTTGGDTLLPLHPALFHAAIQCHAPILPAAISYAGTRDHVKHRIAYWGDMTLLPHLHGVMRMRDLSARIRFRTTGVPARTRAQAASMCESVLQQMMEKAEPARDAVSVAAEQMTAA